MNKAWTKRELSLRQGPIQLAVAVIEQWHKDGEPEQDAEAILYWKNIIDRYNKEVIKNEN